MKYKHPSGAVSKLPVHSGDGYNYGGGLLVNFGERSFFLGDTQPRCKDDDELESLARVMAAAPDLLDALKNLGDWLAYGMAKTDGAEPTAEDLRTCEQLAAAARAAVDKAEGK